MRRGCIMRPRSRSPLAGRQEESNPANDAVAWGRRPLGPWPIGRRTHKPQLKQFFSFFRFKRLCLLIFTWKSHCDSSVNASGLFRIKGRTKNVHKRKFLHLNRYKRKKKVLSNINYSFYFNTTLWSRKEKKILVLEWCRVNFLLFLLYLFFLSMTRLLLCCKWLCLA